MGKITNELRPPALACHFDQVKRAEKSAYQPKTIKRSYADLSTSVEMTIGGGGLPYSALLLSQFSAIMI